MANTDPLQPVEFRGWHEYESGQASAPISVVGFEIAVVHLSASMTPGDRIEFAVEGRKRSSDWRLVGGRKPFENPMRIGVSHAVSQPITVNLKVDSFDELRVLWRDVRGKTGQVEARASLRKAR